MFFTIYFLYPSYMCVFSLWWAGVISAIYKLLLSYFILKVPYNYATQFLHSGCIDTTLWLKSNFLVINLLMDIYFPSFNIYENFCTSIFYFCLVLLIWPTTLAYSLNTQQNFITGINTYLLYNY